MDTLFVQFYSSMESHEKETYFLHNGFSDTHDYCKKFGDHIWVYHNRSYREYDTDIATESFPIEKGTAYVSASYFSHLYTAHRWAELYPNVKFIVGGPILQLKMFDAILGNIPKNLYLFPGSVEDYFKIENFSFNWKLDVPDDISKDRNICFNYVLDDDCGWGKCIYCVYTNGSCQVGKRRRRLMDFEFKDLDFKGTKIVRVGTGAMSASLIKNVVPNLPNVDDIIYRWYMRPTKDELNSIREVEEFPRTRVTIGLEYPGKRMWNYMKKGYSKRYVVEVMKNLVEKDVDIAICLIAGWPNLIEDDLKELEDFMESIPDYFKTKVSMSIYRLYGLLGTDLYDTIEKGETIKYGTFIYGHRPKLSEHQLDLNTRSKEIMVEVNKKKGIDVYDFCSFEDGSNKY